MARGGNSHGGKAFNTERTRMLKARMAEFRQANELKRWPRERRDELAAYLENSTDRLGDIAGLHSAALGMNITFTEAAVGFDVIRRVLGEQAR